MHPVNEDSLVDVVMRKCQIAEPAARRSVRAIVQLLGASTPLPLRLRVASLCADPLPATNLTMSNLDSLVMAVAALVEMPRGAALEQIRVVCAAVAEAWPPGDVAILVAAVPTDIGVLFHPADVAAELVHDVPRPRRTLSSAHPAATHPISESPLTNGAHSLATGHQSSEDLPLTTASLPRRLARIEPPVDEPEQ